MSTVEFLVAFAAGDEERAKLLAQHVLATLSGSKVTYFSLTNADEVRVVLERMESGTHALHLISPSFLLTPEPLYTLLDFLRDSKKLGAYSDYVIPVVLATEFADGDIAWHRVSITNHWRLYGDRIAAALGPPEDKPINLNEERRSALHQIEMGKAILSRIGEYFDLIQSHRKKTTQDELLLTSQRDLTEFFNGHHQEADTRFAEQRLARTKLENIYRKIHVPQSRTQPEFPPFSPRFPGQGPRGSRYSGGR